jgi:hypothetical protein
MSCFIDGIKEDDSQYKGMVLDLLPEVKKHEVCQECLKAEISQIKMSECKYFILVSEQSSHLFLQC